MLANREALGSILEATWLTSTGASARVLNGVPLEMAFNTQCARVNQTGLSGVGAAQTPHMGSPQGLLCLWRSVADEAEAAAAADMRLCADSDVRAAQERLLSTLPRVQGAPPDRKLMAAPIWSTWASFKMNVTQSKVEEFASQIVSHGYPRSHLEIDDRWSSAYGDFTFDAVKFPSPAAMVERLHAAGFSVTVWIIPFAEPNATAFAEGARLGHWLKGPDGAPAVVPWWQGKGALLNVSSADACAWFVGRLRRLMAEVGIDGFKFDAGETQFVPRGAMAAPNEYARLWSKLAASLGAAGARARMQCKAGRSEVLVHVPMASARGGGRAEWRGQADGATDSQRGSGMWACDE
eukprot:6197670-Pleurochrysis_carterae.AAC.1